MADATGDREGSSGELIHDSVKDYYGKRVKTSDDLMTNCCTIDRNTFSSDVKEALKQIHPEVLAKNYGCGAVYPEAVAGCKVLDLGSGAGLDCFVLSKLVGQNGHVTGVDMTEEQIEVSRRNVQYHTEQFGYTEPNIDFIHGYIERLGEVGIEDGSVDVIVSNCVVNLSPDKEAVLRESHRVLAAGGELYFSDIYSSRPVPETVQKDKVLWGECMAGALEWRELIRIAMEIGFAPPILVTSTLYKCGDSAVKDVLSIAGCEDLHFCSATYRLIKVEASGDAQNGTETKENRVPIQYEGTMSGHEDCFKFSCHETLPARVPVLVPESISTLLRSCPRLSRHFNFTPPSQDPPTESAIPPLTSFASLNPFEVTSKSVELGLPKNLSCCGGSSKEECGPPQAKRSCCANAGACVPDPSCCQQEKCAESAQCCSTGD